MLKKLIMSCSIIVGIGMNTFGENESLLSPQNVLTYYNQAVSRLDHISMRIRVRASSKLNSNPPKSYFETELNVLRDGNNLEFFGTRKVFDINGVYMRSKVECHLFKEGQYYFAAKWPVGGKPLMAQVNKESFAKDLCLRLNTPDFGGPLWSRVGGCDCKSIWELLNESDDLRFINKKAIVNDVNCFVLSGSTKYGTITVWISPERSYNAVKWSVKKEPRDFYNDHQVTHAEITRIFEAIDFVKIGDTFVVCKGRSVESKIDAKGEENLIYEIDVSDIQLNPDFNVLEAFKFRIPDDTPVTMVEHLGVKYIWQNEKIIPDVNGSIFEEIDKTINKFKQQQ